MIKNESEYYSLKLAFEVELLHIQKLKESNKFLAEEIKRVDDEDLKNAITENEEAILIKMDKIEAIRDSLKDCGISNPPSYEDFNLKKSVDKNIEDGPIWMNGFGDNDYKNDTINTEPMLIASEEVDNISSSDSEYYDQDWSDIDVDIANDDPSFDELKERGELH